jgi:alanine racemase
MLDNYGTWLEIDLSILKKNFALLSEFSGVTVMPVVKANAYGHGLERVAIAFEEAGAEWFGVARIEEALMLREVGIKAKILVLGYTPPNRIPHALQENISLTVYDPSVAVSYAESAKGLDKRVNIHTKVETGMGRLGIPLEDANNLVNYIHNQEMLSSEGVFTHFACADEPEKKSTANQITKFFTFLDELDSKGLKPEFVHAANSAGAINFPEARFNLIRSGIALYGHPPSTKTVLPEGMRSAISWKTRLISIKELPPKHGISYGHTYHTKKKEHVGTIAVGYGDGFRRQPGNYVLLEGKIAPIIGNVCMDQCMINLDGFSDPKIGDEVVIIGAQSGAEISSSNIANNWNTINYEVLCGLAARMPRNYLNKK